MALLLLAQTAISHPVDPDEVQLRVWNWHRDNGKVIMRKNGWDVTRITETQCSSCKMWAEHITPVATRTISILFTAAAFTWEAGATAVSAHEYWGRLSLMWQVCTFTLCTGFAPRSAPPAVVATADRCASCCASDSADCWRVLTHCSVVGASGVKLWNIVSCCSWHSPAFPARCLLWLQQVWFKSAGSYPQVKSSLRILQLWVFWISFPWYD